MILHVWVGTALSRPSTTTETELYLFYFFMYHIDKISRNYWLRSKYPQDDNNETARSFTYLLNYLPMVGIVHKFYSLVFCRPTVCFKCSKSCTLNKWSCALCYLMFQRLFYGHISVILGCDLQSAWNIPIFMLWFRNASNIQIFIFTNRKHEHALRWGTEQSNYAEVLHGIP